jgi:hypothetical protein
VEVAVVPLMVLWLRENAEGSWQFQVAKVLAIIGTISPIAN